MLSVEELKKRALTERRRMIKPTVAVDGQTPQDKTDNSRAIRRVIAEHRAVLAALKNR